MRKPCRYPNYPLLSANQIWLKKSLTEFHNIAAQKLSTPSINSNALRKSQNADWSYRPKLWSGKLAPKGHASLKGKTILNEESEVFHDSKTSEISVRQIRNQNRIHLAPFGIRFDVMGFAGSYISLMIELPETMLKGASKENLISLAMLVETQHPCEMYARLNMQNGPNTHELTQEVDLSRKEINCEFDLFFSEFKPETTKMWVDLILENPIMNEVTIRDCCIHRRIRAAI